MSEVDRSALPVALAMFAIVTSAGCAAGALLFWISVMAVIAGAIVFAVPKSPWRG